MNDDLITDAQIAFALPMTVRKDWENLAAPERLRMRFFAIRAGMQYLRTARRAGSEPTVEGLKNHIGDRLQSVWSTLLFALLFEFAKAIAEWLWNRRGGIFRDSIEDRVQASTN